ncbi:hypothetical protein Asulf_02088 [Archaeoglobus sulfaticallidus PM70-1]|uniref:Oxaloacetate decarboxylase, gamma chain n=1 Tax=Archaeoglobus sulfaticallidus PM70-1 TaxID=387631 RepID=N0BID6_9EURY|nr:OadG family protein [Archaeoglobus sulfaticallidus]AGK62047.1 hypothetical protein Asulf_02088 [Archaeoglobus sulfaticallidus PM70-1]
MSLTQALAISAEGISGVFIVLGLLALFIWLMGFFNFEKTEKVEENQKAQEKFSEKEKFAIIAAIYHLEEGGREMVVDVMAPSEWKKTARVEQVML